MKQSFIEGAVIVSAGGIIAKILGAFYRIPLTNLLGGEGMGIYQMVYPLYCLLLTLASAGVPAGLARICSALEAQGRSSRGVLLRALQLFVPIGAGAALLMFLLAPAMSALQRQPAAAEAYRMLAPAVLCVCALSCFRGWFQGRHNFLPTALSEVAEQAVKVAFGLFFAYTYRDQPARAVAFTLLAVTLSELFAAALLWVLASPARGAARPLYAPASPPAGAIFRITLPVAVAAGILPLSHLIDSVLIVRLLSRYAENATALYGLFAGAATTLVNLPASVCYGLAAASVPAVSAARARGGSGERQICFALKCTLFIAFPAAAFLLAFPAQTCAFLFRSIAGGEGEVLAGLVRALSVTSLLLSAVQTLSACLTGSGRPKAAAFSMTLGVAVKLAAEAGLLLLPQVGILGAAYAAIACYLVALLFNLYYSIKERNSRLRIGADSLRFALFSALAVCAALPLARVHVLLALAAVAAVYLLLAFLFRAFTPEELSLVWKKKSPKRSARRQSL